MNESLIINKQRTLLAKKLSGASNTLSSALIQACIEDMQILLSPERQALISRFGVLARFLDNLLDDDELDHRFLEDEIRNPRFLFELAEFKAGLDPLLSQQFEREGVLAMRVMGMYQKSQSMKLRFMESKILARLYSLLIVGDSEARARVEKHLGYLFSASYMFCDLKDRQKDQNNQSRLAMAAAGFSSTISFLAGVRNPLKISQIIFRTCKESLRLSK